MHMKYFGDSYDIVKMALLGWLRPFGEWSVHPMLTEHASETNIRAFERFLGARIISNEVLTATTDREAYLSCAIRAGNLFLDPDTGLRAKPTKPLRSPEYLFLTELIQLTSSRPKALTLIFDQSLPRGRERTALEDKVKLLRAHGVHCFAYVSHACFLVTGHDRVLVSRAHRQVMSESRLPESRFIVAEGGLNS